MVVAFGYVALDYPAPFLKGTMIYRSLAVRVVLLLLQTFLGILYYQVCVLSSLATRCVIDKADLILRRERTALSIR